jgi:CRP-like cAMP-binding protein
MPFQPEHSIYFERLRAFFNNYVSMTSDEFDVLKPYFEVRYFDKKEQIVRLGEVDNYFNIIAKGLVRKYTLAGKKEVTLQLATEGHAIHSEVSFNRRAPSDVIVETIEPSVFLSLTYDNLQAIYNQFPRTERLGRLVTIDMYLKKDLRDYSHFRQNSHERFLNYLQNHQEMVQRVPQKYLASYLHIKPETFSRLKHLVRKNKS